MTLESKLSQFAGWCATASGVFGLIGLGGWITQMPLLRSVHPDWPAMPPAVAAGLLLSALAVHLLRPAAPRGVVVLGHVLAAVVTLFSLGSLIAEVVGTEWHLGAVVLPVAPNAAVSLLLAGLGLHSLGLPCRPWFNLSVWFGLIITGVGLLSEVNFLLPVPRMAEDAVSLHTAAALFFLGLGLTTMRLGRGFLDALTRGNPLKRPDFRLLALVLALPVILYVVEIRWLFPTDPAMHGRLALLTVAYTVILLRVVFISVLRLEKLELEKKESEAERDHLLQRLQQQAANLQTEVASRTTELLTAHERLQLALRSGGFGVWDWDMVTDVQHWDDRQCALYGIPPGEYDGRRETWLNRIHPDDRARIEALKDELLVEGTNADYEYRIVLPDGHVTHIAAHSTIYRDAQGRPLRQVGLNRDITPDREHENAVTALNERLQFVLNATGYGVWEYEYATDQLRWDDHLLEMYGLPRGQLAGGIKDWHERIHPDDRARIVAEADAAIAGQQTQLDQQFRIVRPDGVVRFISARGYLMRNTDGTPQRMIGFDNDITNELELREELRITEERWRLALSSNNDGVWDWNFANGEVYRDTRYAEIIGYRPEELTVDRHIWQSLGHPEDIPGTNAALAAHLDGQKPVYQSEYRLRHKAGYWVWVLDRGKVIARDAKGQALRMVGTQTDITARKLLEERLRHGEEMSLQLGRLAQIGAWEWDLTTTQLTWSPEMFRIHEVELGYEPTLAKSLEFYPPHAKNTLSEALQNAVRTGTGFDLELPFTTGRSHKLWVRVLGRAEVKDGHAIRVYGAFQDITGRRDAEEMRRQLEGQLFQAQKMETLGTLAGGIAHDFNNLLTGILGYQDLALDTLPEGDQARNYLGAAREASMRARELIDQILTFSRQAGSEKVPVNLGQLVEDARRFLRATVPATIRIEVDIAPDCGRVLADATQLHQVLLNLGSNAAHAMRSTGGTMRLTLAPVVLDDAEAAALNHLEAGRYLKLSFSDTGHGMDEETRKRIFDPFFTTKEVGQGTGLGLSVVHGIIQAHRGTITVDSAPGHGATFTLYFPIAQAEQIEQAIVDTAMPRGSGELIAVVDDEDIVRSFAQMALEKIGYRVAAFDSPAQCLEALRRSPDDFTLLLTDQTMPVMKGIELAAEVRTVAAQLPVVIMSGYFSRISPDKLAQLGHVALLSKPFTNEELARTVHRAIRPDSANSKPPF
ncbi:MAG: PAS domain-containing protein [Opitutae bacterium]|nr:PAS domain-containing protein [Opitutae bacterium]